MIEAQVREAIQRGDTHSGEVLSAIVDEFRLGRDVIDILSLLDAERAELVSIGAWILGELETDLYNSDPFVSRLHRLLEHSDPGVRFNALGAIFPVLDPHSEQTRELLARLRSDPNEGVRTVAEAAATRLGVK